MCCRVVRPCPGVPPKTPLFRLCDCRFGRSMTKGVVDDLDIAVLKWDSMLESTNTAEDGTFVALSNGTRGVGCCRIEECGFVWVPCGLADI